MTSRILTLALCLVLLSACAPIDASIADMLAPPRINERQTQVVQALSAHVNLDDIHFQHPRDGDYRSPFVFSDMDGNGLMDAMVFYSSNQSGGSIRVKVLREQPGGEWLIVADRAGFGDTVQIVRFAHLMGPYALSLLVGWEDSATGQRRLDVFSFRDGQLQDLYQTFYTVFDINRFLPGTLEQIALVRRDQQGNHQLDLLGRTPDGRLTALGEAALSPDISQVLNLTRGTMRPGVSGIFVDARRLTDSLLATEIFEVTARGLIPLVADIETEVINVLYQQTLRPLDSALLSVDLRRNGRVVVPVPHEDELPGFVTEPELGELRLTLFMRYNYAGILEVADTAAVDTEAGYLFFFPEHWVGYVTIQRRPERNTWYFYEVNPLTNLPTTELLRIRVFYIWEEYRDQHRNYIHLADRGIFQYYGYIPNSRSGLAITEAQLQEKFMLLWG